MDTTVLTHLVDAIFSGASDTVKMIGAAGIACFLLGCGFGMMYVGKAVWELARGIGNATTSAGKMGENLSEGIADMIGFPVALIQANQAIQLARIGAEAQKNKLRLINGAKVIEFDSQGLNSTTNVADVLKSLHGPSQTLYQLPETPADVTVQAKQVGSRSFIKLPGRS